MSTVTFIEGLLAATVTSSTPLLLGSLGEIISERAGVLNLGVEGMMLVGALSGYATTVATGSPYLGLLVGTLSGVGMALIHAVLTVSLKADQVISGIMLTILGIGLTNYFGSRYTGEDIGGFDSVYIPLVGRPLSDIPLVGEALFHNPVPDYIALTTVPLVWYFLFRANIGAEIIAVGEDPQTADTSGINVTRLRYLAVLLGGGFAGAAGAHLALAFLKFWAPGMVAGRGWIVIGLVIFAHWRPVRGLVGAYLFGGIAAFAIRSQSLDIVGYVGVHPFVENLVGFLFNPVILSTYPYVVTILILVYVSIRSTDRQLGAPGALLEPYMRESE